MDDETTGDPSRVVIDRRRSVLESALTTFGRFGYRKASMDQVAQDADISRPGLYFLFTSKQDLFRAAVTQALEHDLAEVERALRDTSLPRRTRLVNAFDQWAGRYVGPGMRDVAVVVDNNPDLLGPITDLAPARFSELVTAALATDEHASAAEVAQTLVSTSVGLKHQVDTRAEYCARMAVAITLLTR